jgi:hypothetical protein
MHLSAFLLRVVSPTFVPREPTGRWPQHEIQRKSLCPVLVPRAFPADNGERKFRYLDLTPEQFRDPNGALRTKKALRRWGASSCFKETDLYTVKYGRHESTDIERFFFGKVDDEGRQAVEFLSNYNSFDDFRGDVSPDRVFNSLLTYMSIQKFRTPKGLRYLSTTSAPNLR